MGTGLRFSVCFYEEWNVYRTWVLNSMISRIDRAPKTWPYTYGGKQGRVASRATSSSTGPSFNASFTWNDLGQAVTVTYPGCTFSPGSVTTKAIS